MTSTATSYQTTSAPLTAVLDAVPPAAWGNPSPCEGWAARDVVRHLIETQRDFLTGRGADLGPLPDVDADPAAAWRAHATRVADVLADDAFAAAGYDGFFGPTTVGATLEQFYVWDMVVHRWDVARAAGIEPGLTDAEVDRMEQGAQSFGEALYMDGICRPGTEAPAGADRATQVLALLGRAA
ncbi:TIGR03086 family protein [Geodermatophilus sabuli]|uniref:TIGR03086 family protein n=1 Tax=Geodermatophilus sabuli TaxID=1564158 RepID=A0A7K3VVL6_9ACTN|nr:TIGR03086 family metal-binding protein [Geodermatophilus sabuli]NEK56440.1 TIGR03086 family protein [Geodermatophilus sabuli]